MSDNIINEDEKNAWLTLTDEEKRVIASYLYGQKSYTGKEVLITDNFIDAVFKGQCFGFSRGFVIGSSDTLDIVRKFSTYVPAEGAMGLIIIQPGAFFATNSPVDINFYSGPSYTGGTTFKATGLNSLASKLESGMEFIVDPTVTDPGTLLPNFDYTLGVDTPGVATGGGSISQAGIAIVSPAIPDSLLRIQNKSGAEITLTWQLVFYEV